MPDYKIDDEEVSTSKAPSLIQAQASRVVYHVNTMPPCIVHEARLRESTGVQVSTSPDSIDFVCTLA